MTTIEASNSTINHYNINMKKKQTTVMRLGDYQFLAYVIIRYMSVRVGAKMEVNPTVYK